MERYQCGYPINTGESVADFESIEEFADKSLGDRDMSWREHIVGDENKIVDALAAKLSFDVLLNDDSVPDKAEIAGSLERIPMPWFIKRRMMKWLLKDVHHYLFNFDYSPRAGVIYKVQDEIRTRTLKKLKEVKTDKHMW